MATITSAQSGAWGTGSTWVGGVVPANGDSVIIAVGHEVGFNVNQSGFANGLAALTINGVLYFYTGGTSSLKMNGNITGTGSLIVANIFDGETFVPFIKTVGFTNVYENDNADFPLLNGDTILELKNGVFMEMILVNSIQEVDETQGSYFIDDTNPLHIMIYVHKSDSSSPIGNHTIYQAVAITRPPSGTESTAQLIFNSSDTINLPNILMYGWHPDREFTQLDADADLNATQIVLKEDLGLQAGDKILIASGTEAGRMVESNKGVYTVQSYDAGTKTVTLTIGLQTARLSGDYVAWVSRAIKISRVSGNTALVKTNISGIIKGVYTGGFYFVRPDSGIVNNIIKNWIFDHVTSNYWLVVWGENIEINNSLIYGQSAGISAVLEGKISNCIFNGMDYPFMNLGILVVNSIFQNINLFLIYKCAPFSFINCILKNLFQTSPNNTEASYITPISLKNTIFDTKTTTQIGNYFGKIYECLFVGNEIIDYTNSNRPKQHILESFNHNRIEGNYKAWCKGGRIETVDNKLKFICESVDYPVFRDYIIHAPANRTIKFLIGLTKDTAGIVSKLQIIDPSNDPLTDTTATPLAESTAQNKTDSQQLGIAYKSTTPKQLILRILCQNSSGNVIIDTTRIDQILAKRIN